MDNKTAKNKLRELRDSLSKVLDGKEYSSSEEIKEQSQEAIQQARSASKQVKKSILERIKDLPVVQKVSELGTAGSVAVSTAAVAQTTVAVDQTEIFVANVANDVVEERFEIPAFIDNFVDFHELNDWGQIVLTEKVSEAQAFVSEVSEQRQIPIQSSDPQGSKSGSAASSQGTSSDAPSQKQTTELEQESEEKESKAEEKSPSEETKNDSEKDKGDKQEQAPQEKTEDKQASQENNSSSEPSTESRGVKSIPIIETPIEPIENEIAPHSNIRQVSPTS